MYHTRTSLYDRSLEKTNHLIKSTSLSHFIISSIIKLLALPLFKGHTHTGGSIIFTFRFHCASSMIFFSLMPTLGMSLSIRYCNLVR